ncbi:protoglobin domain-containing protein [Bradyrhizobium sp. CCBAU 45384]|uniref:protoglobin domain-containing protein n=1 Tax=Bradyrhizobium sp. CCBAU 45384 TaxID=858428 RepID=UPI002305CD65|nr:protoglobin domain-containing protein [Bradyrhizobium sp. CCBAU 45384]MDA9410503.1 hypothetical protein [Bradyrhizobium sp. CCBAU 45384]
MMTQIIRYLGIDTRTQLLAERLWGLLDESSDLVIADFYRRTRRSHVGFLLDERSIKRLMVKQKEHWHSLFNSGFDQAYLRGATKVGIMHRELGLDPRWYVAGYALMKSRFTEQLLFDASIPPPLKVALVVTLEKYVAVDMALTLSSYSDWLVD